MTANGTIGSLLGNGARRLAQASESPRLDAELLLAHALGVTRAWLMAHENETVDSTRYRAFIERRAGGEPLAYIVGFKDFWTLRLAVTPAVLVPRPETELLVERALALYHPGAGSSESPAQAGTQSHSAVGWAESAKPNVPGAKKNVGLRRLSPTYVAVRAVDLGTGSGAIALALASERPAWHITATDASAEALAIARANASALKLTHVEFLQGSWLEPLEGRRFDLILSNPPYIAPDDPALEHPALKREPLAALSPGPDGLAALRAIIQEAPRHLERGGWLLLEHGATQAIDVARELVARGFDHVTSRRDLAGHERMTEARWA